MNRYGLVIIALSIVIASIAIWEGDWGGLLVPAIGIVVVCAPMIATRDSHKGYDERLMGMAIVPLAFFIVLFVADQFYSFVYYYEASIAVLACASMLFGIMIAVYMNAKKGVSLPRRWVIVFAFSFACSLSALWTFSTIYWMAVTGYPLYNGDFSNTLENDVVNMMLMLPMAVTTFAAIIYAIVFNEYLKRAESIELAALYPGGKA